MAFRRHAVVVVGLIAQLAVFLVLISLFFPAVRRALGFTMVCLSVLVVVGVAGFSLYRLATRWNRMMTENPFALPAEAAEPEGAGQIWNDPEPATALDLLEPALRRRHPWRH